jgi:predicted neuraminidase
VIAPRTELSVTPVLLDQSAGRAGRSRPSRLNPVQRLAWIAVTLIAGGAAVKYSAPISVNPPLALEPASAPWARAPQSVGEVGTPRFERGWVSPEGQLAHVHCSMVSALPSGDLLALWYGGSREGAADVAVFTSRMTAGTKTWGPPIKVLDRASVEGELGRRIKKIGNTVIFPDRTGRLWMVYASVSLGGWSGCALNIKSSPDAGLTWGPSRRLTLNAFFNMSTLVRNKPIYAADGRIGLPVYHEMATKFPQILWFQPGPDGTVEDYKVRNLSASKGLIQPVLVALGGDQVLMMLRDTSSQRSLRTSLSTDNGWTWPDPTPSSLPNPDAPVDALRLADGRILLAYNHASSGRETLGLSLSSDEGRTWKKHSVLERETEKEFSYPQLTQGPGGMIHLTYTWKRERIGHIAFNLAWLDQYREPTGGLLPP